MCCNSTTCFMPACILVNVGVFKFRKPRQVGLACMHCRSVAGDGVVRAQLLLPLRQRGQHSVFRRRAGA